MKQYPSIVNDIRRDLDVYGYDKLDGSNIRAEWSPKQGFYKFGSRKRLLGTDDAALGESIELIRSGFSEPMSKILHDLKTEGATVYFEFYGANSFAGKHQDEPHQCALLDVDLKKKGFIIPETFESLFRGRVHCAKLLYIGKMDHPAERAVKMSELPGMTFEGLVCKAPPAGKWGLPQMFKVKSRAWIEKVLSLYNDPRILKDLL